MYSICLRDHPQPMEPYTVHSPSPLGTSVVVFGFMSRKIFMLIRDNIIKASIIYYIYILFLVIDNGFTLVFVRPGRFFSLAFCFSAAAMIFAARFIAIAFSILVLLGVCTLGCGR